ncbi:hypothetical protein BOX15_Mlig023520g1, partial [Macrostomum lignano]
KLLDMLADPNLSVSIVEEAANQYLSLLVGFIHGPETGTDSSKIRHALKFKWTDSLQLKGEQPAFQADAQFELICMLTNLALWYTKHAAKLSASEKVGMEDAKEVHKCLRIAAGIFKEVKENQLQKLIQKDNIGTDFDDRVVDAYVNQCSAEAQEVTMARAIELEHSHSIVASLASDTARMFKTAELALSTMDDRKVLKWRKYLTFKYCCYQAYAYSYHGEGLLKVDKCGEAIACLREAVKFYQKAEVAAAEYNKTTGPGMTVRPEQHLFFRKLGPHVRMTLEKCERENGFIYHQNVPSEIPELELKPTFGLAAPENYQLPEINKLWTPEAYKGFDLTKMGVKSESEESKKAEEKEDKAPVQPVKEQPIYQSEKDPNNSSGCVVS